MTKTTSKKGGTAKKPVKKPVANASAKATPKARKATKPAKAKSNRAQKSSFKHVLGRIKQDQTLLGRIFFGIAVVLALTYALAAYAAFTTSVIPGRYIGLGFLLSFVLTIGLVYGLTKRGPGAKFSSAVVTLALIGVVINVAIFSVGTTTRHFLDSLSSGDTGSYTEYAIVAFKKDQIKLDAEGQKVSVLDLDDSGDLRSAIAEITPASIATHATPTESVLALQQTRAQMAVFTVGYLDELREGANNELYLQLEILATFRVKTGEVSKSTTNLTEPFAVYISGIDTYGAVSKTSRSDVNILAVVNPKSKNILFVNTPRDYYVQLHGTTGTKDKLTHAGLYGIDMSEQTLEDLYGIDINYNVRINFTSLEKIVNTVGGIEVESEYNFSSGGFTFAEGTNQLNGEQALAFSRERYSFEGGDRTRGQNQMRVLAAVIDKISEPSVIVKYQSILSALDGVFETNMSSGDMNTLIRTQLDTMSKWTVSSVSVDGAGASLPTYSMGAQKLYVMIPNETSLNSTKNKIQSILQ